MTDLIVIAVIVLIVGCAAWYIIRKKKQGVKCIGCPDSKTCASGQGCSGNCNGCSCGCSHEK